MKIYVDTIKLYNTNYSLYVDTCMPPEHSQACSDSSIILTEKDLDSKWIEYINCTSHKSHNGTIIMDDKNRFYILLYLFFSIKYRIFFEEAMHLYSNSIAALPYPKNYQQYFWEILQEFLKFHGFQFKILKGNLFLYTTKPRIPIKFYSSKELLSYGGLTLLICLLKYYVNAAFFRYRSKLGKFVSKKKVKKTLTRLFSSLKPLHTNSNSGCLFYFGINSACQNCFIKATTIFGSDLEDEFFANQRILEQSKVPNLYLLPYNSESSADFIIYPYIPPHSLEDVLCERVLAKDEIILLLKFLIEVLCDLERCNIIHRDIQPANILTLTGTNGKITNYKLIDFGCSVLDKNIKNSTLTQKNKNINAGSSFRCSSYTWDDAASSIYMLAQIIDINSSEYFDYIKQIYNLINTNTCNINI